MNIRKQPLSKFTLKKDGQSLANLQAHIQAITKIPIIQQRLTIVDDSVDDFQNPKPVLLTSFDQIANLKSVKVMVKNLGYQISWRTVFVLEYAGPIVLHLIFLALYRPTAPIQLLAALVFLGHFVKREWESVFVHKFSHGTMPLMNLFKNCAHYWLVSGGLLGWEVYNPQSPFASRRELNSGVWLWAGCFVLAEWGNLQTHAILANLRPTGTTKRAIPFGLGFTHVSCPNYLFESLSWFSYAMMLYRYNVNQQNYGTQLF